MRADIEKYLSTVQQSTAKTISHKLGLPQLDVARELNHMLNDGVVEREKRQGAGNEYHYWLSRAERTPATAAVTTAAPAAPALPPASPPAAAQPDARAALERQVAALTNQLTDLTTRYHEMSSARLQAETDRDELKVENDSLKSDVAKLTQNTRALELRIDELTLGPIGAKSPLFVTVGRYAKPKRHGSLDKAQKRASALIRSEKESEVLVLEPVGRVIRGSEWRPR
ncbi:hypothetical protein [Paraburkholderia sp. SOS3]|uniref:hypothetical protein n=1 Tax=Paraburkholderia sp. SOS3 TaxID=1926494 RepID=UPI0009477A82|nr:hypothetical protein [Paraburkholderia sp. SOS3]APR39993.1 hypothetical protein BTO02_33135 [Paraburkholderia sp. SOS3]